jgi:hypothetical protein
LSATSALRGPSLALGMTEVTVVPIPLIIPSSLVIPSEVEESLITMLDKARDIFRPSRKATARQATVLNMTGV